MNERIITTLKIEINDLDARIQYFKDLMHTAEYGDLPAVEQGFYMMQLSDMQKLNDTLHRRLEHYEEKYRLNKEYLPALTPKEALKALSEGLRLYKPIWCSALGTFDQFIEIDEDGFILDEEEAMYSLGDLRGFRIYRG